MEEQVFRVHDCSLHRKAFLVQLGCVLANYYQLCSEASSPLETITNDIEDIDLNDTELVPVVLK